MTKRKSTRNLNQEYQDDQAPQSYEEFDLDTLRKQYGLEISRSILFPLPQPFMPPTWLTEMIVKSLKLTLYSEKAKSEYIIAPTLLALRELTQNTISIYSGFRFDVDANRGLKGYCDFIISKSTPLPVIQSPVLMLVEAKKNDLESAYGQCAAEMVAAQIFNQNENNPIEMIYGCVTTADDWQFLCLHGHNLIIDEVKYYLNQFELVFGILHKIMNESE